MNRLLFIALLLAVCAPLCAQTAEEKELITIEKQWAAAVKNRDVAYLDKLYAEEYTWIDAQGTLHDRAGDIASVKDPGTTWLSFTLLNLKVHVYKESAVVTGFNDMRFIRDGKKSARRAWFTDVFVRRDGRWMAVATQGNLVKK